MRPIHLVAAIAALAVAVPFASAGKPGSGATLLVTPNDAPAWSTATASGCGYDADVVLDIEKPEALAFYGTAPDSDGCISVTFRTDGPGTYHLQTRQQSNGKKWAVMATYDLPVVE